MKKLSLENRVELIRNLLTPIEGGGPVVTDNDSYTHGAVGPPLYNYRQVREELIKLPDACELLEKLAAGMEELQKKIEHRYYQIENSIDYATEDYSVSMEPAWGYLQQIMFDAALVLKEYEEYVPILEKKNHDKDVMLSNLKMESLCRRREAHSISSEQHFHPSVHLYVCKDDSFLIIKKNKSKNFQGYLDIPGGHVSVMLPSNDKYPSLNYYCGKQYLDTEDLLSSILHKTAQREMKEETGVDMTGIFGGTKPLEPFIDFFIHKDMQNFEFVAPYLIKWPDARIMPECSDAEISEYYWVSKNKIPDFLEGKKVAPALQAFREKIIRGNI